MHIFCTYAVIVGRNRLNFRTFFTKHRGAEMLYSNIFYWLLAALAVTEGLVLYHY